MGEYANIKRRRFLQFFQWLNGRNGVEVKFGSRHLQVCNIYSGEKYPVPVAHEKINRHIVSALVTRLVRWGVATKEEIDEKLQ